MAAIDIYLQQILDAIYGEEVRHSIHDSISEMNVESTRAESAAISAQDSATNSATIATNAKNTAITAKDDAVIAKNQAVAAAEEARRAAAGAMKYKGTVEFANIPTTGMIVGDMYNISTAFTADSRFRAEDVGKECSAGTNIAWDENSKWDIMGASSGSGLPSGGVSGQLVMKTQSGSIWGSGIYYFDTVQEMNSAISGGTVPNGAIIFVEENSGGDVSMAIADISDVVLTNLTDGQVLKYDSTNNKWVNGNASIAIDTNMSTSSSNPLKNSTITNILAGGRISFGVDSQGNFGYKKDGADTVIPFRTGSDSPYKILDNLPYNFYYGSAVVYNNEIHLLGGSDSRSYHYKWNGTTWTSVSTLPYGFFYGSAVVYNNEIHILGGNSANATNHYKWDGTSWTSVSTIPVSFSSGSAVVFNNEIHILKGTDHYKWNGTSWSSVSTLPYNFNNGFAVVFNNELHIFGGTSNNYAHYKLNGSSWQSLGNLPYKFYSGCVVVYKDELHVIGGNSSYIIHYKLSSNNTFTKLDNLVQVCYCSSAVVYDYKIHILGGSGNADIYVSHTTYEE